MMRPSLPSVFALPTRNNGNGGKRNDANCKAGQGTGSGRNARSFTEERLAMDRSGPLVSRERAETPVWILVHHLAQSPRRKHSAQIELHPWNFSPGSLTLSTVAKSWDTNAPPPRSGEVVKTEERFSLSLAAHS